MSGPEQRRQVWFGRRRVPAVCFALATGLAACASTPKGVAPSGAPSSEFGAAPESHSATAPPVSPAGAQVETTVEAEPRAPSPVDLRTADLAPESAPEESGLPIHGTLQTRYRGRKTGDAEDHDFYTTLTLDVGDPDRNAFTGHFMGRGWWDMGGDDPNEQFTGLDDRQGAVNSNIYYAYVDAERLESFETLRVGRQRIWETPAFVTFDGVRAEPRTSGAWKLGAYVGRRTQYYDRSSPDDAVGGVYGEAQPWDGGRLRLDYMYLEDEARLGADQDDLIGVGLRQFLGEELTLEGQYTALEGQSRDVRLRAHYLEPTSDLLLHLNYYYLLEPQSEQALELDPYFSSLTRYSPYHQVSLLGSKGLSEHTSLDVGLEQRWLESSSDEGEFNHEFGRWYLSTIFSDVAHEGLDLTLTADVWDDDQQTVQTWGADVSQEVGERIDASLGSYYSLYKYDLFVDRERDNVRTYYSKLRYEQSDSLSFDIELNYENDDYDRYASVRLGATWQF